MLWLTAVPLGLGDGVRSLPAASQRYISIRPAGSNAAHFCASDPACLAAGLDLRAAPSSPADSSLPEPASIILFGSALLGLSRYFSKRSAGN